jgi:hypothetical protein
LVKLCTLRPIVVGTSMVGNEYMIIMRLIMGWNWVNIAEYIGCVQIVLSDPLVGNTIKAKIVMLWNISRLFRDISESIWNIIYMYLSE